MLHISKDRLKAALCAAFGVAVMAAGSLAAHDPNSGGSIVRLRHWNEVAMNATGLDHRPVAPGESREFGEQIGPGRSARALAIIHIALFETLRLFYGTDQIPFSFVSDEFNGVTTDHTGAVRPLLSRSFSSLSEAEEENGQSRIYLGIHWSFDKTAGIAQGRQVAQEVFGKAFRALAP